MTDMTEAQVFDRAIDVLHERGWHQGSYRDPDTGAVCIIGAISTASRGSAHPMTGREWSLIATVYRHLGLHGIAGVAPWNDAPERTVEDVFLALKQCREDALRDDAEAVAE